MSRDHEIWKALTQEDYSSVRFDWFCISPDLLTNSLREFFTNLASGEIDAESLNAIGLPAAHSESVAFIDPQEIERHTREVLSSIGYQGGIVSLKDVCDWQGKVNGLRVIDKMASAIQGKILGRISFSPPTIILFSDPDGIRRRRFTLAHELGHLLLRHSAYLQAESVEANDIENAADQDLEADDLHRLEWQANHFASCLLMPREQFIASVLNAARGLNLVDRGHGFIYLDHQPVNVHNYQMLTSRVMENFGVSRTAVRVRLQKLGLLNAGSHTNVR